MRDFLITKLATLVEGLSVISLELFLNLTLEFAEVIVAAGSMIGVMECFDNSVLGLLIILVSFIPLLTKMVLAEE